MAEGEGHPSWEELDAHSAGGGTAKARARFARHLETCETCEGRLQINRALPFLARARGLGPGEKLDAKGAIETLHGLSLHDMTGAEEASHPVEETAKTAVAYLRGNLRGQEKDDYEAHVRGCRVCAQTLTIARMRL